MSATLDSEAVFEGRCDQLGLSDVEKAALKAAGLMTYSKYAWSCAYQPYAGDETPFIAMLVKVFGAEPPMSSLTNLRRLFAEAHSMSLQEMRSKVERTDDAAPQRLLPAERASRYEDQKNRLSGMDLTGAHECSNALIDAVFQQYEDNSLKWLPLENLTSREQELLGQKKDPMLVEYLTKIQSGKMVVQERRQETEADLSTDLRVRLAWVRRSLAYDQAHLFSFLTLEKWSSKLVARMYETPPPGFRRVTLQQCITADQKLWTRMSETCRASIQPVNVAGVEKRPLDAALLQWIDHSDVLYLIQPLPMSASEERNSDQFSGGKGGKKPKAKASPYSGGDQKGKGGGKTKGKGRGAGKGKGKGSGLTIPAGCCSKTADGRFICYGYNDRGCANAVAGASCEKGWHLCGVRGCNKEHPMSACPGV